MSFVVMSNPQLLLFDDQPIESILYGEPLSEASSASLFCDTQLYLDEIDATLSVGNFDRGFELLRSYLHSDQPVPARACFSIIKSLQRQIPLCLRPDIPELAIEHIDVVHSIIALARQYELQSAQYRAETMAYRWHEARGEYAQARAIIATMRDRVIREGDDLETGILTNNHAYEHLLEREYQAAEDGFREAHRLFERTKKQIEIVNVRANILTCRFEIQPQEEWDALLPELKEIHRGLMRNGDWRARKTMRLFAKRAAARGRISNAIGWARRAAAASGRIRTLLHQEDCEYVQELQQLKSGARTLERLDHTAPSGLANTDASRRRESRMSVQVKQTDPSACIMGLETEYAFTPFAHNGRLLDRTKYSQQLVSLAPQRFATLCGRDAYDLFLGNGARLYVDSGIGLINTEYATPECSSPAELLAHVRAGDLILAELAAELQRSEAILGEAFVSKCNFDYSGTTSGSHENYLHVASQARLARELIPHLVSRIVYTGGGGFNDKAPNIEFMLSPRVRFLEQVVSSGQQENRAIFTTKMEPLSVSRYGRLQLLCGEGVRCETSEYLRFGVTALLIKLVDLKVELSNGIGLNPLLAMNLCARDTKCKARIGQIHGKTATALDIQRHYLDHVEKHLGRPEMPDWASDVCSQWARVLDELATDPLQLAGTLDWPTKLGLYKAYAEQKYVIWQTLIDPSRRAPEEIRAALFEFDVRFGDVAENSVFASIRGAGIPGEAIVDENAITRALTTPPQGTRARLRGEWIEKLSPNLSRKRCGWSAVWDKAEGQIARFDDPYGRENGRQLCCAE